MRGAGQGSTGFESAEHEEAMDNSEVPDECLTTETAQVDGQCHDYLRPHVKLCGGKLTVAFVWLGQDTEGCVRLRLAVFNV